MYHFYLHLCYCSIMCNCILVSGLSGTILLTFFQVFYFFYLFMFLLQHFFFISPYFSSILTSIWNKPKHFKHSSLSFSTSFQELVELVLLATFPSTLSNVLFWSITLKKVDGNGKIRNYIINLAKMSLRSLEVFFDFSTKKRVNMLKGRWKCNCQINFDMTNFPIH